uniref:Uncharacterized protein n=1 Tax=Trichogramma kaykai TaxID=54128 RepID=A0ABD2XG93_9HYME
MGDQRDRLSSGMFSSSFVYKIVVGGVDRSRHSNSSSRRSSRCSTSTTLNASTESMSSDAETGSVL